MSDNEEIHSHDGFDALDHQVRLTHLARTIAIEIMHS
jgi:hypothetical protein